MNNFNSTPALFNSTIRLTAEKTGLGFTARREYPRKEGIFVQSLNIEPSIPTHVVKALF
jgi:hypothetical protein